LLLFMVNSDSHPAKQIPSGNGAAFCPGKTSARIHHLACLQNKGFIGEMMLFED
jgi:hypothetical protein